MSASTCSGKPGGMEGWFTCVISSKGFVSLSILHHSIKDIASGVSKNEIWGSATSGVERLHIIDLCIALHKTTPPSRNFASRSSVSEKVFSARWRYVAARFVPPHTAIA
ncbi:MAG TPA: hypothetical protein VF806_02125, partial [Anaerolineaceae bacterium]